MLKKKSNKKGPEKKVVFTEDLEGASTGSQNHPKKARFCLGSSQCFFTAPAGPGHAPQAPLLSQSIGTSWPQSRQRAKMLFKNLYLNHFILPGSPLEHKRSPALSAEGNLPFSWQSRPREQGSALLPVF